MAAPTNLAEAFNKTLANGEPSTHGTGRKQAKGPECGDKPTFIPTALYGSDPVAPQSVTGEGGTRSAELDERH
jgi:hypothetical protein